MRTLWENWVAFSNENSDDLFDRLLIHCIHLRIICVGLYDATSPIEDGAFELVRMPVRFRVDDAAFEDPYHPMLDCYLAEVGT